MLVRNLNQNEPLAAAWEHSRAPSIGGENDSMNHAIVNE